MNRRELKRFAEVRALTLIPRGVHPRTPSMIGPLRPTSIIAESVGGVAPFLEGDDPRKLDHRLTALYETDIAKEYEEPRLETILVLLDGSDSVAAVPEVGRAIQAAAIAIARALALGGHAVDVALPPDCEPTTIQSASPSELARAVNRGTRRGHGKSELFVWVRAQKARGRRYDRLVFLTDAAWPRTEFRRALGRLRISTGVLHVLVLTPEREYHEVSTYSVKAPGSRTIGSLNGSIETCMSRLLRRLGREASRVEGVALSVVRWDDDRRFLGRFLEILPGLFD